jgi:uncharacterized protein YgiM (DUF1202 family)
MVKLNARKKSHALMRACAFLTVFTFLIAGMAFAQPALADTPSGTWTAVGGPVSPAQSGMQPVIAVGGGTPYVAYDLGGGYAAKYANGSWSTLPEIRPGNFATSLSLQVYNNTLYAGFLDGLLGHNAGYARVKKYDGTKWVQIGSIGSSGSATDMSMVISGGTLYVAYTDNNSAIVKKYTGSAWENVGASGLASTGIAQKTVLKVDDATGTPYVAYTDETNKNIIVRKYSGGSWTSVGNSISLQILTRLTLAVGNGQPYIGVYNNVYKLSGTSWQELGDPGTLVNSSSNFDLALSGGVPYYVFTDGQNGDRVTLRKYNGSAWENVGPASSVGIAPSLAFENGVPYIAYLSDIRVNVQKYVPAGGSTPSVQTGTVVNCTTSVNVRSGPGTTYSIIGPAPKGAKYTVTGQSGSWYKIDYNGKTGYISSTYLSVSSSTPTPTPTPDPTPVKTGTVVNCTTSVNVRSGPGTTYSVIGSAPKGAKYTVTGQSGSWYKIDYSGKTGYISSTYLSVSSSTPTPTPTPVKTGTVVNCTTSVNVRSGPGTTYAVIGSAPKGAKYTVTGQSGSWYKINYNGKTGYISASYLSVTSS